MRRLLLLVILLMSSVASAQTTYYMAPLDLRQYYPTNDCEPPDDVCIATGVYLGFKNGVESTHAPQYFVGADVNNDARGAGSINSMTGGQLFNTFETGGTCDAIYGVNSFVNVANASTVTAVIHVLAQDSISAGSSIPASYGLYYVPSLLANTAYAVFSPQAIALLALAGRARIGDTGDPTTGYDLDVQGPLLVNGGVNIGQATSTPGATPTATSATATATAVTPTPMPTSTPPHLIKGDVGIDGNIIFIGNVARFLKVGPCTTSPCSGKGMTVQGGDAKGTGAGGPATLQAGNGAALGQVGGNAEVLATGAGGGNARISASRGFLSALGRVWLDGDITNRLAASASRPTFSAGCGSTASDALATNNQGRITMSGIGQTGSCVVTFGDGGFTNIPVCHAQFSVDGGVAGHGIKTVLETTTNFTITNAVLATGVAQNFVLNDVVKYWCVGRE